MEHLFNGINLYPLVIGCGIYLLIYKIFHLKNDDYYQLAWNVIYLTLFFAILTLPAQVLFNIKQETYITINTLLTILCSLLINSKK